jgi:hypothetical protein
MAGMVSLDSFIAEAASIRNICDMAEAISCYEAWGLSA